MAVLAILGLHERFKSPIALTFSVLMAAACFWAFLYAFETSVQGLNNKIFLSHLQFLPISLLPVVWLLLTLQYFGQIKRSRELLLVLLFIPIITNILVWTDSLHHLFRYDYQLSIFSGITILKSTNGPWFLVYAIYNNLLFLFSLVLTLSRMVSTPAIYRQQIWVLLTAMIIPLITDLLYTFGLTPNGFCPTPAVFVISGLIILLGILQFGLMSIIPIARETIIEHMQDSLIVIDSQNRIVDINPSAIELVHDKSLARLIGLPIQDVFPFLSPIWHSNQPDAPILMVIPGHTSPRHIECRVVPIYFRQNITGRVVLIHDVTRQVQFEKELRHLSTHDILTGLYNRTYFEDQNTLAAYHLPVSIVMIDLDDMKKVNDSMGHAAGDELLKRAAHLLKQHFPHDSIIARFGGDEFVVLMWQINQEQAAGFIEGLRAALAAQPASDPLIVRMSMGFALASSSSELPDLLRRADHAMYTEKHLHHMQDLPPDSR